MTLVPTSSRSGVLTLLRSGVLNAADYVSEFTLFSSDMPAGILLVKLWAIITGDLNWTGVTNPILTLVHNSIGDPGNGLDDVVYDLNAGFPNGGNGTQFSEFMPLYGGSPDTSLTNSPRSSRVTAFPTEILVSINISTFTAGRYEVFALVAPSS